MLRKSRKKPLDVVFELLREGRMREGAELLYRECYNKVYGIAFSILHDEGKSEDVVHNVVGKIITLKTENAPTDGELRWLYKLTKNTALDYLNAAEPTLSLDEVAPIACEDRSIAEFVDMDAYYSMIKGLDERRKRVVTLKVLGGYTHREIAGITKLPIGTVMWLYNTAIQQLRITLASMLTLILAVGVIFVERLSYYYERVVNSSPSYGGPVGGGSTVSRGALLNLLFILGASFLILSVLLVLNYLHSDKLRSRAERKNEATLRSSREYLRILLITASVLLAVLAIAVLYNVNQNKKSKPSPYGVVDSHIYLSHYGGEEVDHGGDVTDYEYYFELVRGEAYLLNFEVTYRNGDTEFASPDKTRLSYDEDVLKIEYVEGIGYKLVPIAATSGTAILFDHDTLLLLKRSGTPIVFGDGGAVIIKVKQ